MVRLKASWAGLICSTHPYCHRQWLPKSMLTMWFIVRGLLLATFTSQTVDLARPVYVDLQRVSLHLFTVDLAKVLYDKACQNRRLQ